MRDAFHAPGALDRTVAHPGMGEIPATMLFDLRLGELAVHGWDLARAIGADESGAVVAGRAYAAQGWDEAFVSYRECSSF